MHDQAELAASRVMQDGDVAGLERRISTIFYRTYGATESQHETIAERLARSV